MKKLILLAGLFLSLSCEAGTFTYTWVPAIVAKPTKNIKPVIPSAVFTVDESVVVTGFIPFGDVFGFYCKWPAPANYIYRSLDDGLLVVDSVSGQVLDGSVHATDLGSTYGHGMSFGATHMWADNPLGGASTGYWRVSFSP